MSRSRRALLAGVLACLIGCQSPAMIFSAGALNGPVAETDSFAFAAQFRLMRLEVRPRDPYSVNIRVVMRGDRLNLDAAEGRRWPKLLKENPNVRVKLGNSIYPATAYRVDDPELTRTFMKGRTIYRLKPRKERV